MSYQKNLQNSNKIKQNKQRIIVQFLFTLILFLSSVKSDLPVHCLNKDILGKWKFTINKKTFTPSLENGEETSCGHGLPNQVVEITRNQKDSFASFDTLSLDLKDDFSIMEKGKKVGSWTLVYDQSLFIKYKDSVITAPFKYYKKSGDPKAESDCSKTFLGWFVPDNKNYLKNWSCFFAEKIQDLQNSNTNRKNFIGFLEVKGKNPKEKLDNIEEFFEKNSKEFHTEKAGKEDLKSKEDISFIQTTKTFDKSMIENNLKYEQMGKVIKKINNLNLGWEADVHNSYIGMSLAEVKHQLGLNKGNYNKNKSDKFSLIQMESRTDSLKDSKIKDTLEEYLNSVEKQLDDYGKDNKHNLSKADYKGNTVLAEIEEDSKNTNANLNTSTKKEKEENLNKSKLRNKEKKDKENNCGECVPKIPIDPKHPMKDENVLPDDQREKDSEYVKTFAEMSKYLNSKIEDIDERKLPKNWDWRNVGGVSFIPPISNQGHCGSCYTFSTITCLESRLRIQTNNKDKTRFSKQYPLACNFYSEGCDGGYPFFVSKFSKEFELVPQDCFKYTQTTNKCSNVCDFKKNPNKYSVSDFGYIGGAYGKTNEALMMKELRARGPIPGNMLVHWSFQYYSKGIFSENGLSQNSKKINLKDLLDYGVSWAKVEHSITLVGYGEENGIKYWIGMNTWGKIWGDKGFFKILRGENEAMIESMGEFMNVKKEKRF